jgi:hypothetical protein
VIRWDRIFLAVVPVLALLFFNSLIRFSRMENGLLNIMEPFLLNPAPPAARSTLPQYCQTSKNEAGIYHLLANERLTHDTARVGRIHNGIQA